MKLMGEIRVRINGALFLLFLEVLFSTIEGKRKKAYLDCLEKASSKNYLKIFLECHTSKEKTVTTLIEYMKECKTLRLHDILYSQCYIEKKLQKGLRG